MNRRQFIQRLSAALAAAGIVQALPASITSIPETIPPNFSFLTGFENNYRIAFPDGTTFQFKGVIEAVSETEDDFSLRIKAVGPLDVEREPVKDAPIESTSEGKFVDIAELEAPRSQGTMMHVLSSDGTPGKSIEILDILLPSFDADNDDQYLTGLRRTGSFTIQGTFIPQD